MGQTGNFGVLVGHSVACVNKNQADIRTFNCKLCPHHRKSFYTLFHLALPADSGRVDQKVFSVLIFKFRVNRITCRSGNIAHNHAFFAQDFIHQ